MTVADHLPLDRLEPVDLAAVLGAAELARRVDRKYLVPTAVAAQLVDELAGTHRVLEIGGRRSTTYRSTYLDTDDLRLCRDHLQGRRLRWKARSRLYVEDRLCRFEVKLKGSRGETVKHTLDVEPASYGSFGARERLFVASVVGGALREAHADLEPVLEVGYSRATLADLRAGTRVTIDHGVAGLPTGCGRGPLRGRMEIDPDRVVVETKGGPRPGAADRLLSALGHRPVALSKYATSAALLADDVADNVVRRLVGRGVSVHVTDGFAVREGVA